MKQPLQGVYQKHIKFLLPFFLVVLLAFLLAPSPTLPIANSELVSEVFDSVVILDSYFISHSGSAYTLHVLVKREADFIPIQIRLPGSSTMYTRLSLTRAPNQHCPFADRESQAAGIVSALKTGELIAYDSHSVSGYSFAGRQSVDLIVEVDGELFVINRLQIFGGCFWAQE